MTRKITKNRNRKKRKESKQVPRTVMKILPGNSERIAKIK